jgi:protein-S-isoprenylcysteine O-methyltransferase Ste14
MARPFYKQFAKKFYPTELERAIYVLSASICCHLLLAYWVPMPFIIFKQSASIAKYLEWIPLAGFMMLSIATSHIDHFQLFGIKQAFGISENTEFTTFGFYRHIRHPMMTGFFISFWITKDLTVGRLLFAGVLSIYILMAVFILEEPGLIKSLGATYKKYIETTPAFFPFMHYRTSIKRHSKGSKKQK